jgi:hypothetical protein
MRALVMAAAILAMPIAANAQMMAFNLTPRLSGRYAFFAYPTQFCSHSETRAQRGGLCRKTPEVRTLTLSVTADGRLRGTLELPNGQTANLIGTITYPGRYSVVELSSTREASRSPSTVPFTIVATVTTRPSTYGDSVEALSGIDTSSPQPAHASSPPYFIATKLDQAFTALVRNGRKDGTTE